MPTGIVYNPSGTGFGVSENGKTGSSVFLFDTAGGTISGWSPSVDSTHAIVAATNPGASTQDWPSPRIAREIRCSTLPISARAPSTSTIPTSN